MKLPFALRTAHAVRELIDKKFDKTLGRSTMPLYLKSQKPLTPRGAARSARDRGLADAGLPVDRGAGEAREVSNRGLMRFKLYEGALNGAIYIDFLHCLVTDAKQG